MVCVLLNSLLLSPTVALKKLFLLTERPSSGDEDFDRDKDFERFLHSSQTIATLQLVGYHQAKNQSQCRNVSSIVNYFVHKGLHTCSLLLDCYDQRRYDPPDCGLPERCLGTLILPNS